MTSYKNSTERQVVSSSRSYLFGGSLSRQLPVWRQFVETVTCLEAVCRDSYLFGGSLSRQLPVWRQFVETVTCLEAVCRDSYLFGGSLSRQLPV